MRSPLVCLLASCTTALVACTTGPTCTLTMADVARDSQPNAEPVNAANGTPQSIGGAVAEQAWFTYEAHPSVFSTIDPHIRIDDSGLVACAYNCSQPEQCPAGTTPSQAPNGTYGCCAPTPANWQQFGCSESPVWMSVENTHAPSCRMFSIMYNW